MKRAMPRLLAAYVPGARRGSSIARGAATSLPVAGAIPRIDAEYTCSPLPGKSDFIRHTVRWVAVVVTVALNCAAAPAPLSGVSATPQRAEAGLRPGTLRSSGRFFVDERGRAVILRGVNLAGNAKVPPFLPCKDVRSLDPLQNLGMNVVRLLFLWEAYEPEPGQYDEAYLANIQAVARGAWDRGMYVVIDFHQDGFSRHASRGSGDGFPAWAVSRRGRPSTPDNGPKCKNWALRMATDPTTHRSFNDFFGDVNGVRTRYLAMMARVAGSFAAVPGVIGYDLINEPWGDEPTELAPLYRDAAGAIRAAHPGAILFLEGHVTTNCGIQTKLPRPGYDNVAYAPHFYRTLTVALNRWYGTCVSIDLGFHHMNAKSSEWNVPLFVGEFGAGAETRGGADYIATLYDRLDARLASGAQWNYTPQWNARDKDGWNAEDFNIIDPSGELRANFRPRPYPRITAGVPLHFQYSEPKHAGQNRTIEFTWEHHPELGETEIFVPSSLFSAGATVTVSSSDVVCRRDAYRQTLLCSSARGGVVTVRVAMPVDNPVAGRTAMTSFRFPR